MRVDHSLPPLTSLSRRTRIAIFFRSLLIQGSWNYQTLIGTGFAFALLPALREIYGEDEDELSSALERHSQLFNSHPYLAPLALGAIATMEGGRVLGSGEGGEQGIDRFKMAIRSSLGTLGDRLIWTGWRPLCLLGTLTALLIGVPWWIGLIGFLSVYNTGQILLRIWALRVGLDGPQLVGKRLRSPVFDRLLRVIVPTSALLIGVLIPLIAAGLHLRGWITAIAPIETIDWVILGFAGALAGALIGHRARDLVIMALVGGTVLTLLIGLYL